MWDFSRLEQTSLKYYTQIYFDIMVGTSHILQSIQYLQTLIKYNIDGKTVS